MSLQETIIRNWDKLLIDAQEEIRRSIVLKEIPEKASLPKALC